MSLPETSDTSVPPAQIATDPPPGTQDSNTPAGTPRASDEKEKTLFTLEDRITPEVSILCSKINHQKYDFSADFQYLAADCQQFPIFKQSQNMWDSNYTKDVNALWEDCVNNPNFFSKSSRPLSAMSNSSSHSVSLLTPIDIPHTSSVNKSIDLFASYDNIQNVVSTGSNVDNLQSQMILSRYNSHENLDSIGSLPQNQMGLLHFDSPVNDISIGHDSGCFTMSQSETRTIFHCSCVFEDISSVCCYCSTTVLTDPYLSPCYGNIDNARSSCAFNTDLSFIDNIFT